MTALLAVLAILIAEGACGGRATPPATPTRAQPGTVASAMPLPPPPPAPPADRVTPTSEEALDVLLVRVGKVSRARQQRADSVSVWGYAEVETLEVLRRRGDTPLPAFTASFPVIAFEGSSTPDGSHGEPAPSVESDLLAHEGETLVVFATLPRASVRRTGGWSPPALQRYGPWVPVLHRFVAGDEVERVRNALR